MSTISERLHTYMNYKNLTANRFATLLGYEQSEKIQRLVRDKTANPSVDILKDITNKFADINIEWILTGNGEMLKKEGNTPYSNSIVSDYIEPYGVKSHAGNTRVAPENAPPNAPPTAKNDFKTRIGEPENKAQNTIILNKNQSIYNLGAPKVVTVSENQEENILYVPVKARAGYLMGYGDPHYIETLPSFRLPGLSNATYRMFEVEGPSMAPTIMDGDRVVGEWVSSFDDITENRVYIVVTRSGVAVKRVLNRVSARGKLVMKSDTIVHRADFRTYEIDPADVLELWYCRVKLSSDFSEPSEIYHRVSDLEGDIAEMRVINGTLQTNIDDIWKAIGKNNGE